MHGGKEEKLVRRSWARRKGGVGRGKGGERKIRDGKVGEKSNDGRGKVEVDIWGTGMVGEKRRGAGT